MTSRREPGPSWASDSLSELEPVTLSLKVILIAVYKLYGSLAINASARAYVSKVTTNEERTTHTSLLSLFQTIGFIIGPAVQAILSPIGEGDANPESHIVLNLYTATGLVWFY